MAGAAARDLVLAKGLTTLGGKLVSRPVAKAHGLPYQDPTTLLPAGPDAEAASAILASTCFTRGRDDCRRLLDRLADVLAPATVDVMPSPIARAGSQRRRGGTSKHMGRGGCFDGVVQGS